MRARAAASLALIIAAAAVLAECSLFFQPETQQPYDPSDGINANIGDLLLRDVIVVSEDGELGNLVMVASNAGPEDLAVTLQYETAGTKHNVHIEVPANATVDFGFGDGGQLLLEDIGTMPGSLLPLYVQYGNVPGEELQVPVIDGSLAQYQGFLPTPTPTPTPTPSATETPTPSATPVG